MPIFFRKERWDFSAYGGKTRFWLFFHSSFLQKQRLSTHSFWRCSFFGGLLTTLMIANRISLLSFPPFLSTPWQVLFHGHPRVQLGRGLFNFVFLRRNKAAGTAVKIEPNCGLYVFGTRQGGQHYCYRIISHFKFYFFLKKSLLFVKFPSSVKCCCITLLHISPLFIPNLRFFFLVRSKRNQLQSDNYCYCNEHVPHDLNTVLCLISLSSHYKAN